MIDRFERFSLAISENSRCLHKLAAEELATYELSSSHAIYLITLLRYEDGITAAKLGELCYKDKADVSRMLNIMTEKGLVHREGAAYRARVLLTEEGRRAAEYVRRRAAVAVELAGEGIDDQDREVFYASLATIVENLRILSRDGLPEQEP